MNRFALPLLLVFFMVKSLLCNGQAKPLRWTNKDKGRYIINPHVRGINDSSLISLSFQLYELSSAGCKMIDGQVIINGKRYEIKRPAKKAAEDQEESLEEEQFIDFATGNYSITATAGGDYYSVKTGTLNFTGAVIYKITFYLIRKDELKNKSVL